MSQFLGGYLQVYKRKERHHELIVNNNLIEVFILGQVIRDLEKMEMKEYRQLYKMGRAEKWLVSEFSKALPIDGKPPKNVKLLKNRQDGALLQR